MAETYTKDGVVYQQQNHVPAKTADFKTNLRQLLAVMAWERKTFDGVISQATVNALHYHATRARGLCMRCGNSMGALGPEWSTCPSCSPEEGGFHG